MALPEFFQYVYLMDLNGLNEIEYFSYNNSKNIMSEEEDFGIPLEQLELMAKEC
jgi:hypothetical protein